LGSVGLTSHDPGQVRSVSSPAPSSLRPIFAVEHAAAFDVLPHCVALVDQTGVVVTTNTAWETARPDADPVTVPVGTDLIASLRSTDGPQAAVADHIADGIGRILDGRGISFAIQYQLVTPADLNEALWFLVMAEHRSEGGVAVTRTDTTVHHGVNEVLAELAFHDDLTGLPNRGLLLDRVRMALIRAQRLSLRPLIVFTDLDGFKDVNDRHGHDAGDAVLVETARRLTGAVREGDTCGRWGGDEFVLVVELGIGSDSGRLISRIERAMALPFPLPDGTEVSLGMSIGAVAAEGGERVDALIARADQAMYRAKRDRAGPVILDSL